MLTVSMADNEHASVLQEVVALHQAPMRALQERFKALFGEERPPANREFLIRRIAFKIQENAFGGLSEEARKRVEELKEELNPLKDLGCRKVTIGKVRAARQALLPGTVIRKEYKNAPFEVRVLDKGFEFQGKPYRTLTKVAEVITGVHQSGYVFFFGR